jgi:hypothetical protein
VALIPGPVNPMTHLRRRALRRAMRSDNELRQLLALLLVGRPALVRRAAFRQGFRGRSRMWRSVAVMFLIGDLRRKLVGREVERLGVERLTEGQGVTVSALSWRARRQHRSAA